MQVVKLLANQDEMLRRMEKMDKDLDAKFHTKEAAQAISDRLEALEDTVKWVTRTILGVVILAVLGTIIVVKKGGF